MTGLVSSRESWVMVPGSCVTRVMSQLTDGSRGSWDKTCDPLSALGQMQGRLLHINDGANAPWKKYGGKRFCRNLGGSALIINALPLSFCKNAMINF